MERDDWPPGPDRAVWDLVDPDDDLEHYAETERWDRDELEERLEHDWYEDVEHAGWTLRPGGRPVEDRYGM